MHTAKYPVLALLILLPPLHAAELLVVVRDVDGVPIENAVVTLSSGPEEITGSSAIVVDQQGKQFRPWVATVRTGGEVTFSNHDDITHHVYSFSPAKRFSFRLQPGEQQPPVTFDEPGIVVLGCNIHDWMVGYVHVSDGDYSGVTDAQGSAKFSDIPAGHWQASLWHPGLTAGALPPLDVIELADAPETFEIRLRRNLVETGPRKPLDDSSYALP